MRRVLPISLCALLVLACGETVEPVVDSDDPMDWGRLYVRSSAVGREALEQSLVEADNGYTRLRLANYGPGNAWNELPVADPLVRPVRVEDVGAIEQPWSATEGEFERVGEISDWSHEEVLELGRRAFERYPLGIDQTFHHALDSAEDVERFGLWRSPEGRVGGLVRVRLSETDEAYAPTCSTCHASVADGAYVPGRPNADFDYDAMALHGMSGKSTYPPSRWGAGAVDVTSDQVSNPVAMADLRAVSKQRNLHWAGTIENSFPALVVRIETLIITSLGDERPPREVAFAIAYYLWNLGEAGESGDSRLPGAELFEQNCASCHGADGWAGPPVSVSVVGTDAAVAESSARGLQEPVYRVPSLWKVGTRGQLLHHGEVSSLDELLDPDRLQETPGHEFGLELSADERGDLIQFVRTIGQD